MAEKETTTGSVRTLFQEIADRQRERLIEKEAAAEPPKAAAQKEPTAKIVRLPAAWPDDRRGAPNALLRSALFSAGTPTLERKTFREHPIAVLGPCTITYSGPQLYQPDLDVWLELVHRCRSYALGDEIIVRPRSVLRALGRAVGKPNREWLISTFATLRATAIHVVQVDPATRKQRGYISGLVDSLGYDSEEQEWSVRLDPRIAGLFAPETQTWLHSSARLALGRGYLAKWLHGYYSTHRSPLPLSVRKLYELSGSATKQLRDFRRELCTALDKVAAVERAEGRAFEWWLEDDAVHVRRGPRSDTHT